MKKRPVFLTKNLITNELLGSRYAQLTEPFRYYSAVLGKIIEVPEGFICDYESVPIVKGSSKRAGVIHDYLCRVDSNPAVSKQMAATVYGESQACRDALIGGGWMRWARRKIKTSVVRVAWGYFHKIPVMATLDEVSKAV